MKNKKLEITVFICGSICMVLELLAARILSPYVGSSNIIWTSIIGIILASMSLGYYLGGKIADKSPQYNMISFLIIIAAIYISFIPIFEVKFVEKMSSFMQNNLIVVSIISALVLFFIPSFIMAMVSPYAIRLKETEIKNIGKLSGKLSSLSTIGSIVGTFLSGFYLIPNFGTKNIILGITILLIVLAIILRENKTIKFYLVSLLLIVFVIIVNKLGIQIFNKENKNVILDIDSQYSRIFVEQVKSGDTVYKTLKVDNTLESYLNETTNEMGAKYLKYYDLFEYYLKDSKSTLMLGGAAYTYPMHYLNKYQDKTMDVVEIDKETTKLAKQYFGLCDDQRLKIFHMDGRSYLNTNKKTYDVIFFDTFKGMNSPFELLTYEALKKTYESLNDNGIVIANVISSVEGSNSKFLKYEYNTYKSVFNNVKVFKVNTEDLNTKQNIILAGIKGNNNINDEKYIEYKGLLDQEVINYSSDKKILTDSFCPIGN